MNYNPDEQDVDNSVGDDIGTRIGASYVDQFEFDNGGSIGWSVGGQRSRITQPEQEVRSTSPTGSSLFACVNNPNDTATGFFRTGAGDCEDGGSSGNNGFDNSIDPATDLAVDQALNTDTGFAFTGSTRGFRQNETADERDAFFGAFQYQPNDQWDINFDVQWSERDQREERHDLNFETRRTLVVDGENLTGDFIEIENNELQRYLGEGDILIQGESFSRLEKYLGGGLAITYNPTDALTLDLDVSRSRTTRRELQISNQTNSRNRQPLAFTRDSSGIHQFFVQDFNVNDPSEFFGSDRFRTRIDNENDRENISEAIRFDVAYDLDSSVIKTVKGGLRASTLSYLQLGGNGNSGNGSRTQLDLNPTNGNNVADEFLGIADTIGETILTQCGIDFRESGFLSGTTLVTSVGDVTNADNLVPGSGPNEFVSFDNQCFADAVFAFGGQELAFPDTVYENVGTIDVEEDTIAAYVLADYEFDSGLRGNFGVRVVNTEVDSIGFRSNLSLITDETGVITGVASGNDVEAIRGGNDYTEVLPSFQAVYDLNDEMIVRGGVFRGMSRVDPDSLGFQRTFNFNGDPDGVQNVQELLSSVVANGNPESDPILSWNVDASWEWYPDDDTVLAIGLYYKTFNGGVEQVVNDESFVVDGQPLTASVTNQGTSDEDSDLYGIEITGSYRWDIGVGVKVSYNHAETNFEFEDNNYGATFDADGNQLTAGIVEPGDIPGFSEDVFSGQLYYQIGDFDIAAIYKYRSSYFQPFTSNGNRLRYVDDVGVWEARASYKLNNHVKFKVEAINLFSEERTDFFYTEDNFGQLSDYGPRIFVGTTIKF